MPRYEYDVVNLKVSHDEAGRRSCHWQSRRGGCHHVDHNSLEEMLNRLGDQGWHVVSHDTDARFGSHLILQRVIEDGAPASGGPRVRAVADPVAAAAAQEAATELKALRAELAARATPASDPALLAAVTKLEHALARPAVPVPTVATLDPAAVAQLVALTRPEAAPVQAVVDPAALAALEETIRLALAQAQTAPAMAVLDPAAMEWLEATLKHRDDGDEPPAAPPVAVLDEGSALRIGEALARSIPAPTANLSLEATALLTAIANRQPGATTLDADSVARLEAALTQAVAAARPTEAVLTPELVHQLEGALAKLPTPTVAAHVEATATLSAEAVASLRSALTEALACAQAPITVEAPVDVAPLVAAITPLVAEIRAAHAAPLTAQVSEAALVRIERAVGQLVQAVEIAAAPRLIPAEPVKETKPARAWLPRLSGRLRWATR